MSRAADHTRRALARLARFRADQERFHATLEFREPVSCARGCDACCSQMVFDVRGVEVEDLGRHLRETGRAEAALARLRHRRELYDRVRRERPRRPGEDPDDWTERVARAFWAEGVACAFLDADGSCSVYEHRPQSCRRFFVHGPPALCAPDTADDPRRRALMAEPGEEGEADHFLDELSREVPFDPEDDRLDHALVRWLELRSPT